MKKTLSILTAATFLVCCSSALSPKAFAQCQPCDYNFTGASDWGGCTCPTAHCDMDPTQFCSISTIWKLSCGPNMCNVDSVVIKPASSGCFSICAAANNPPLYTPWSSDHTTCSGGNTKLLHGAAPILGANGSILLKICSSSTGDSWNVFVYSNGSIVPCDTTISN